MIRDGGEAPAGDRLGALGLASLLLPAALAGLGSSSALLCLSYSHQPFRSFSLNAHDPSSTTVSRRCMAEAVFDDHPLEEYFRRASIHQATRLNCQLTFALHLSCW